MSEVIPSLLNTVAEGQEERPDSWQVYTLADAYAPREPLKFVVPGLFPQPSLSVIFGAPGSLKSMLLADLLICAVTGSEWLPTASGAEGTGRTIAPVPAMWIDLDNGSRRTHERFAALALARDVPESASLYYYSMPMPWPNAADQSVIKQQIDRCRQRGVQLLVVDNLGLIKGPSDENSSEMIRVMGNLRLLAEETGAAVIVIHHQRKSNGLIGRAGESLRGHSSIEASIDLGLLVEREADSKELTIRSTKTRDVDVAPFGARFEFAHKADTSELATAKFYGVPVDDSGVETAIEAAILEVVMDKHPIAQNKLKAQVKTQVLGAGLNRICEVANQMVKNGTLKSTTGARNAILYDLP